MEKRIESPPRLGLRTICIAYLERLILLLDMDSEFKYRDR